MARAICGDHYEENTILSKGTVHFLETYFWFSKTRFYCTNETAFILQEIFEMMVYDESIFFNYLPSFFDRFKDPHVDTDY
jgi:hypothetical protein